MIDFKGLKNKALANTHLDVRRQDVRVDPNNPQLGPYYIILTKYEKPLTEENQDSILITSIKRDKHRIDKFSEIEFLMKELAQDPFDPKNRTLNGKIPRWELPDDKSRYHISCDAILDHTPRKRVKVTPLSPPLSFPKDSSA